MRALTARAAIALGVLALFAPQARAASPELVLTAGSSLGVNGDPGGGGFAGTLGLLWPVEGRFAFGGVWFVDDQGTGVGDLNDPNSGGLIGTVATHHRWSFGGEWRAEATVRRSTSTRWAWNTGFGYLRQERDTRGQVNDAVSGLSASVGTSILQQAATGHMFGIAIALRHAFLSRGADAGRSTDWATAALEWRWQGRPGK